MLVQKFHIKNIFNFPFMKYSFYSRHCRRKDKTHSMQYVFRNLLIQQLYSSVTQNKVSNECYQVLSRWWVVGVPMITETV